MGQRTMWDEAPNDILQCIFYRYLRFHRDGRAAYLCCVDPPEKVIAKWRSNMKISRDGVYTVLPGGVVSASCPLQSGALNEFTFDLASSGFGRGNRLLPKSHTLVTGDVESALTIEPGTIW